MTEFSDDFHADEQESITRFLHALNRGEVPYFDVHEFETIIDYLLEQGEHSQAKKAASVARRIHPQSVDLKLMAARVHSVHGELDLALHLINEVQKVDRQNEELFYLKAGIHAQMKDHNRSIENLRIAKELSGDFKDEILLDIAFEQENLEDYSSAIESLQEALAINPNNEAALHELAHCYESMNKLEDLVVFYQQFIDNQPYSVTAWYNLGNTLFKLEDYERAMEAYDYCLAIDENYTLALYNRANSLIQLERYPEAVREFEAVMASEGIGAHTLCYIGECYEKMNDLQSASEHYLHALEIDNSFTDAMIGMAVVNEMLDEQEASARWYKKALKDCPESAAYWHMYAMWAVKNKRQRIAVKAFKQSLKLDELQGDTWEDYGTFLADAGKLAEAYEVLARGFSLNPDEWNLVYRMIWYGQNKPKSEEVGELLSLAAQNDPEGLAQFLKDNPEASSCAAFAIQTGSLKPKA